MFHRRQSIDFINYNLNKEIEFLNEIASNYSKVYQYWFHRKLIIEKKGEVPLSENLLDKEILNDDNKNYHYWSYKLIKQNLDVRKVQII